MEVCGPPSAAEKAGRGKAGEAGKGVATCSPGSGSVVVVVSGYQSPAHFYIQLEDKQEELLE